MGIAAKIKSNPRLKLLTLRILMPKNQARPRKFVAWFINPFIHHKGKGAVIRRRTRLDVLPFNKFSIGNYSTVEDFTAINNCVGDIIIGDRSIVGLGRTLIGPITIGNDVGLAQGILLTGMSHNYEDVTRTILEQGFTRSPIIIEDDVWVGANCVIFPGIVIGKHSVVSAGSVVTKDVPPYSVVSGNPARLLRQYNHESKVWRP